MGCRDAQGLWLSAKLKPTESQLPGSADNNESIPTSLASLAIVRVNFSVSSGVRKRELTTKAAWLEQAHVRLPRKAKS